MKKRTLILGAYDTAANGWTLAACHLSDAEEKTNFLDKPGGDGSWDLSTALTDGVQKFKDRTLTATLECSEGDRLSRKAKIDQLINQYEGLRVAIVLPDDVGLHINGKLHIVEDYNDLAHAAVTVTATCEPWKYSDTETIITLGAVGLWQTAKLINNGRRAVVPTLEVTGSGASVLLEYGAASLALSAGTYEWPELLLMSGNNDLRYSGKGTIAIKYREAVLK